MSENLIEKLQRDLMISRQSSGSRRQITVPDRPDDLHTPLIMGTANPMRLSKASKEVQRQKTGINNDLPSDLLFEAGIGAPSQASKTKTAGKAAVLPPRRGKSLNPLRLKTQSNPDLTLGGKLGGKRGETPTNTAGDSTAFSKRSNATRVNMEDDPARP